MESLGECSSDELYEKEMYSKYVHVLLGEKLYNARDAYDACHYLMVPLHYAFQSGKSEYIQMFQEHMDGFASLSERERAAFRELSMLDQLHYLYFASEYMCLCIESGITVSEELFLIVYQETYSFTEIFTGAWKSKVLYEDFWEHLDGVLIGEGYGNGRSYSNVITDIDLFILTIICDLKTVYDNSNIEIEINAEIFAKAVSYADIIFSTQVTWYQDGTWQLQVGAWKDHPDYIYAGTESANEIKEGLDYRVEDCTWDSGHFMRIPMFLRSYIRAALNKESCDYYEQLLEGYGKTFVKNVLVVPDEKCRYYRINNYMDGRNGLYRYGYNEEGIGIGPYQNSVCFLLGLYAFCGNDTVSEAYCITAKKFPLDAEGKEIYTDPTTIREQNPIFTSEDYRQFLCFLAGRLRF